MKLYNTETKKKEELKPISKNEVKIYSCGPTVYNYAHIGNLRTYLNVDFLRRSLQYLGYKVNQVTNITDIEDKIIRDSQKEGLNPANKTDLKKFAQKYEQAFFADLDSLNIQRAEHSPHATDEKVIKKMIEIIIGLMNKKIAYQADDGVYFSVANWKNYGRLVNLENKNVKEGARVDSDEYDKEDIRDFALWKAPKPGEPSWSAPFGEGRPGWHIECSAMAFLYLGETLDIHAGGVDLIFPHHENEIAQSEAFSGKRFVKHWFHAEHLLVDGERMGKSLGNFYTLNEMAQKFKVTPTAYRMLALMSHYREKLNFTAKSIQDAQIALNNIRDFVLKLDSSKSSIATQDKVEKALKEANNAFKEALEDDLNTAKALAAVFKLIKEINKLETLSKKDAQEIKKALLGFDSVLGLGIESWKAQSAPINVTGLIKKREKARKDGDWSKADEIRKQVEEAGWGIEDTPEGPLPYIK